MAKVEKHFECLHGCVKCCNDTTIPITVSIDDLKRIANYLKISPVKVFSDYCIIGAYQARDTIIGFIPNLDFPRPCKFLDAYHCSIYPARPLSCRTFPYNLRYEKTGYQYLDYVCIEKGLINYSSDECKALEEIRKKSNKELKETNNFFDYKSYPVIISLFELNNLLPEFNRITGLIMTGVKVIDNKRYAYQPLDNETRSIFDPRHNLVFMELVHKLAESKIQSIVGNDFIKKIDGIS